MRYFLLIGLYMWCHTYGALELVHNTYRAFIRPNGKNQE